MYLSISIYYNVSSAATRLALFLLRFYQDCINAQSRLYEDPPDTFFLVLGECVQRWLKFAPLLLEFAAAEVISAKITQEICKWKPNKTRKKNSSLSLSSWEIIIHWYNPDMVNTKNLSLSLSFSLSPLFLSHALFPLSLFSLSRSWSRSRSLFSLEDRARVKGVWNVSIPPHTSSLSLSSLSLLSLPSLSHEK